MPPSERYNYLYTEQELEPWAARIRHLADEGDSTFVVTNNHFQGKGIVNALQLICLLTGAKVKVPSRAGSIIPKSNASLPNRPRSRCCFLPRSSSLKYSCDSSFQG